MQKTDVTKKRLIEAASRMFARFGFKKTTMEEIAAEARKGKSSLYYYFESKEEIFNAVVEYEAEILKTKLIEAIENSPNIFEKFKNYIFVRFNGIKELGNLYNALRGDFLIHMEFIQKARKNYDEEELEYITEMLKEGNDQGVFDVRDVENTAKTLHLTIKAVEIPLLLSVETDFFEDKLNFLIDLFFYGVVKRTDKTKV